MFGIFKRKKSPKEDIAIDNIFAFFHGTFPGHMANGFPKELLKDAYFLGYLMGMSLVVSEVCGYDDNRAYTDIFIAFSNKLFGMSEKRDDVILMALALTKSNEHYQAGLRDSRNDFLEIFAAIDEGLDVGEWRLARLQANFPDLGRW